MTQERDPYTAERDFFDHLYQLWAKTTKADTSFWQPKKYEHGGWDDVWEIYAVRQDGEEQFVAEGLTEADADFITALHGGFGEFIRRVHSALDEAEAKDYDRDAREGRIYELEMQAQLWESEGGKW